VSSTLTGRATFILNPNALLIARNDAFFDFVVPAGVAVQHITQAALDRGVAIESALAPRFGASAKN
jgi:hypothetical protein